MDTDDENGWTLRIQNAVRNDGRALRELERQSGVPVAVISRFARGERTLTLPLAEKLCKALGIDLKGPRKRPPA